MGGSKGGEFVSHHRTGMGASRVRENPAHLPSTPRSALALSWNLCRLFGGPLQLIFLLPKAHNRGLKKQENSRRFIAPNSNSGEGEKFSANELLDNAARAAEQFRESRRANTLNGRLHRLCQRAIDQIRRHQTSIDVIIQQHTSITAPVWGTIRLIFQVGLQGCRPVPPDLQDRR